ncbi:MAG TPA: SIS domain-containing protein [Kineosporiaceae bacterium]|nr:SIS domain-containing protein [Kineosporiaceae bacterium]
MDQPAADPGGSGSDRPTAREAALKLMETSYLSAHAFSAADFMHGPLAMIDEDRLVNAVVPDGVGATVLEPVLGRLHERDPARSLQPRHGLHG